MDINAQDLMDSNNNRAEAIRQIQAFCDEHGFSYSYTQKYFRIKLPEVEPLPVLNNLRPAMRRDYTKADPTWTLEADPNHIPDELPPVDKPLDEGETPEPTEEKG